jgi:hypothetical protein
MLLTKPSFRSLTIGLALAGLFFGLWPANAGSPWWPRAYWSQAGGATTSADFFVATDGNDSNSCASTAAPCLTLAGARDKLRTAGVAGSSRDWRVMLRGGRYELPSRLDFGASDKPAPGHYVTWENYPGEHPVVSGGTQITGFSTNGTTGFCEKTIAEVAAQEWYFADLWVNGQHSYWPIHPRPGAGWLTTAAQVANSGKDPTTGTAQLPVLNQQITASQVSAGTVGDRFQFTAGQLDSTWTNVTDIRIRLQEEKIRNSLVPVQSIDNGTSVVTLNSYVRDAIPANTPWRRENVFEDLSASFPGEHYLNRVTGLLTYVPRPGETCATLTAVAPRLTELIRIANTTIYDDFSTPKVGNIKFKKLTFAYTWSPIRENGHIASVHNWMSETAGAVTAWGADNLTFDRATFKHLGETGIVAIKSKYLTLANSHLYDLGGAGVIVGDEPAHNEVRWGDHNYSDFGATYGAYGGTDFTGSALIHNNLVEDFSNAIFYIGGISVGRGKDSVVTHNTVRDGHCFGINNTMFGDPFLPLAGSPFEQAQFDPATANTGNNYYADNHIYNLGKNQSNCGDFGGFYTVGIQPGSIFERNWIHDMTPNPSWTGFRAIYLDDQSTGWKVRYNVVGPNIQGEMMRIRGASPSAETAKEIYNNIFYSTAMNGFVPPFAGNVLEKDFRDGWIGAHFHRNVVVMGWSGTAYNGIWSFAFLFDSTERCSPANDASATSCWAKMTLNHHDNKFYRVGGTITNFAPAFGSEPSPAPDLTWAAWQAGGQDAGSMINSDPGVNTTTWQVASPPSGFMQLDMSAVGHQGAVGAP